MPYWVVKKKRRRWIWVPRALPAAPGPAPWPGPGPEPGPPRPASPETFDTAYRRSWEEHDAALRAALTLLPGASLARYFQRDYPLAWQGLPISGTTHPSAFLAPNGSFQRGDTDVPMLCILFMHYRTMGYPPSGILGMFRTGAHDQQCANAGKLVEALFARNENANIHQQWAMTLNMTERLLRSRMIPGMPPDVRFARLLPRSFLRPCGHAEADPAQPLLNSLCTKSLKSGVEIVSYGSHVGFNRHGMLNNLQVAGASPPLLQIDDELMFYSDGIPLFVSRGEWHTGPTTPLTMPGLDAKGRRDPLDAKTPRIDAHLFHGIERNVVPRLPPGPGRAESAYPLFLLTLHRCQHLPGAQPRPGDSHAVVVEFFTVEHRITVPRGVFDPAVGWLRPADGFCAATFELLIDTLFAHYTQNHPRVALGRGAAIAYQYMRELDGWSVENAGRMN